LHRQRDEEKLTANPEFQFPARRDHQQLQLTQPIYHKTTNYGHFGRVDDLDALIGNAPMKHNAKKNNRLVWDRNENISN
jgi:S-adenosylmethionine synthetase